MATASGAVTKQFHDRGDRRKGRRSISVRTRLDANEWLVVALATILGAVALGLILFAFPGAAASGAAVVLAAVAVLSGTYFFLAQRRRARDLVESEAMLTNVFEATPFPLLIIGREDGIIRRANRAAHRLFGTTDGGLRGTRAPERCADPGAREALSRLVAEHGRIEDFELAVDGGDGARWVKLSASPINFDGEDCLIVELDDITGHKNLETAQQELLDAVPLPLILSHAETHEFLRLNTRALQMYGLSQDDIATRRASDFYVDPLVRNELVERLRRDGFVDEYETCLQTPSGPQWMTASGRFFRYGGQDAVLVTHAPINARKRLETALQEREAQLRIIFDNASDAIISFAEDGTLLAFNKAAEKMFGRPVNAIGNLRMELLFPPQRPGSGRRVWPVNRERLGMTVETDARYADGTLFPVEVSVSEMWLGERHMYSGIIRDITERRQVEQMKREFISTVSHELRTPLTSISGSLGLVMGGVAGDLPPKAKQLLGIAHKNCERLVRLINDILDLEKAEAGKMDFDVKQVPLAPLVENAIEANRAFGAQFGVGFAYDDLLAGVEVRVDTDRMTQVVTNLLSNAAKFSPRGGEVRIVLLPAGDNAVRVEIRDRGPGIPENFRRRIFQKFAQADSSDTREKGGTGLGLSISKTIVEQLGGRIGFDTELGVGTTFWFELPIVVAEAPAAAPLTAEPAAEDERPRVLICEDDPDIANLIGLMLEKRGIASDVALNADEARQMLADGHYRAMTLDLMLPDTDGLSFLRSLRADPSGRELPVVVVSAKAGEGRRAGEKDGLDVSDWLQKPIDENRLLDAVGDAMADHDGGPIKVLHVEDDEDVVELVRMVLGQQAEVTAVGSVEAARAAIEAERFDIVVLDVGLTDGSGLFLLPQLRKLDPSPPVIIFSAYNVPREVSELVAAQVTKSQATIDQLVEKIHAVVGR